MRPHSRPAPSGDSSTVTTSPLKKTAHASEQERLDVAARRQAWFDAQPDLDPENLVFIDETAVSTKMDRLRGRAPRGQRCRAPIPHGHWKTIADSDEASHRFRLKPPTDSDQSQPGIPTEASRGGSMVGGRQHSAQEPAVSSSLTALAARSLRNDSPLSSIRCAV